MSKPHYLIAAADENMGIGNNYALPWKIKKEFQWFVATTKKVKDETKLNAVIMGRKTWDSTPAAFRPYKGRVNVVITRQKDYTTDMKDVHVVHSVEEAIELLHSPKYVDKVETIWNLGGAQIYKESIDKRLANRIYLTRIYGKYDCDTFFPDFDRSVYVETKDEDRIPEGLQEEDGVTWKYEVYELKNK